MNLPTVEVAEAMIVRAVAMRTTLDITGSITMAAEKSIDRYFSEQHEKKQSVTQLGKDIEKELGVTFTLAYSVISFYIQVRPDIRVSHGRNGGIEKVPPTVDPKDCQL